jgi:hypothetical protein
MARMVFILLLAAALAGCATPDAAPATASVEPEAEPRAALPAFDLLGCESQDAFFVYDDASVKAHLPPGYRPYTVQGIAGALVRFEAMTCDAVVGAVVEQRVPIAVTSVQVGPSTHYQFEWILPTTRAPTLAAWLQQAGWPVLDAEVEMLPGLVTIRGDEVDYVLADAGGPAGGAIPASASGGLVHLVHGEAGTVRLDENQTIDDGGVTASTPVLTATDGALSAFAPGASGTASTGLGFLGLRVDSRFTVPTEEPVEPIRG